MASGVDVASCIRVLGDESSGLRVAVRRGRHALGSRCSDIRGESASPRSLSPFSHGRLSRSVSVSSPMSRSRSGTQASASPFSEEPEVGPRCAWPRAGTPPTSKPVAASAPTSPAARPIGKSIMAMSFCGSYRKIQSVSCFFD
jgi:hypothetical protein